MEQLTDTTDIVAGMHEGRVTALRMLNRIGRVLNASLSQREIYAALLQTAVDMLGAAGGAIALLEAEAEGTPELVFRHTCGSVPSRLRGAHIPSDHGPLGWVITHDKPVTCNDVQKDTRFHHALEETIGFETRSMICAPLRSGEEVVGGLQVLNKNDSAFNRVDETILVTVVEMAALGINNSLMHPGMVDQRNYYSNIMESLEEGVMVVDRQMTIRDTNRFILWLLNSDRELIVGRECAAVFAPYQIKERKWLETLGDCFRQGIDYNDTIRISAHGEDSRHFIVSGTPLQIMDETPVSYLVTFSEVTRLKTAQQEKLKLQMQLLHAQRMESMGEIVAGISHNFRNLLAGIMGNGELLQMKFGNHTEMMEHTDGIIKLAEAGSELIENLMHFARKGTGGEKKIVNLAEILEEAAKIVSRSFDKKITIETDWPPLMPVLGVRSDLSQVLMNLCTNSRDAMPGGGHLKIMARSSGDQATIEVIDSGSGISQESVDRIFDPFFTTKPLGKGTGLGLSTAYGIIKDHGGQIAVHSEIDIGTAFTIHLPLAGASPVETARLSAPLHSANGERVLLVDDEQSLRETFKQLLAAIGYRVTTAENGHDAVERYRHHRCEFVLMDRNMPEMDGISASKKILEMDPDAKIVLISGYDAHGADTVPPDLQPKIKAYLTKPCAITEVSKVLAELAESNTEDERPPKMEE